jgi:hypothetical protein
MGATQQQARVYRGLWYLCNKSFFAKKTIEDATKLVKKLDSTHFCLFFRLTPNSRIYMADMRDLMQKSGRLGYQDRESIWQGGWMRFA